jgi:hypothetical protein
VFSPAAILADETRALLTRLDRVRPFSLQEPALPAAAIRPAALCAIEAHLARARRELTQRAERYLRWLAQLDSLHTSPRQMHERYVALRTQFNDMLSQVDVFSDAITQRSEHGTGVWLAGLDAAASEALVVPGAEYEIPPIICYLDRGPGGAIRRARTRLPGGASNPVAIIRIPRERMIGAGVASSLVHEVGHQGAALLDLVNHLRLPLIEREQTAGRHAPAWHLWGRWISEVVADLWGVARVGVAATLGLMGVVSVPRPFQFRILPDDPHPAPFIRVLLSAALGERLYPDPQWRRIQRLWEAFYPMSGLSPNVVYTLGLLRATMPEVVELLVSARPTTLRGRSIGDALASNDRQPDTLRRQTRDAVRAMRSLRDMPPTLAFAAIGQARADGRLGPRAETQGLASLLTHWALRATLGGRASPAVPQLARWVA